MSPRTRSEKKTAKLKDQAIQSPEQHMETKTAKKKTKSTKKSTLNTSAIGSEAMQNIEGAPPETSMIEEPALKNPQEAVISRKPKVSKHPGIKKALKKFKLILPSHASKIPASATHTQNTTATEDEAGGTAPEIQRNFIGTGSDRNINKEPNPTLEDQNENVAGHTEEVNRAPEDNNVNSISPSQKDPIVIESIDTDVTNSMANTNKESKQLQRKEVQQPRPTPSPDASKKHGPERKTAVDAEATSTAPSLKRRKVSHDTDPSVPPAWISPLLGLILPYLDHSRALVKLDEEQEATRWAQRTLVEREVKKIQKMCMEGRWGDDPGEMLTKSDGGEADGYGEEERGDAEEQRSQGEKVKNLVVEGTNTGPVHPQSPSTSPTKTLAQNDRTALQDQDYADEERGHDGKYGEINLADGDEDEDELGNLDTESDFFNSDPDYEQPEVDVEDDSSGESGVEEDEDLVHLD